MKKGQKSKPKAGSRAFYPRKKAAKHVPSFRSFPKREEATPLNFLGYKAGMTHCIIVNGRKGSVSYNQDIFVPCTVIEAPAMKVYGLRVYKKSVYGNKALFDVLAEKQEKYMESIIRKPKKKEGKKAEGKEGKDGKGIEGKKGKKEKEAKKSLTDLDNIVKEGKATEIRLLVHTQPSKTGIGQKVPDLSEIALGGVIEKQLEYVKGMLGKELKASEVFKEKEYVDIKAVTKGKGMQGPVKRYGISLQRQPKAKKARTVGSISPWHPANVMFTVPRAGQHGYQARTDYNKIVLLLSDSVEKINPKGDFLNYGKVKNEYIVLAGTIPGPAKRVVGLRKGLRNNPKPALVAAEVKEVSLASAQGA